MKPEPDGKPNLTVFETIIVDRLLTPAEARDCVAEIATCAKRTRARMGSARVLIDASAGSIQSGDVATPVALDLMFPGSSDRLAILVHGSLLTMQTKRVLNHSSTRIFQDRGDAVAWLIEPVDTSDVPIATVAT